MPGSEASVTREGKTADGVDYVEGWGKFCGKRGNRKGLGKTASAQQHFADRPFVTANDTGSPPLPRSHHRHRWYHHRCYHNRYQKKPPSSFPWLWSLLLLHGITIATIVVLITTVITALIVITIRAVIIAIIVVFINTLRDGFCWWLLWDLGLLGSFREDFRNPRVFRV